MKITLSLLRALIKEAIIDDYDSSSIRGGGKFSGTPISEWETGRVLSAWEKHLNNRYLLMQTLKMGSVDEKAMASRELEVCDSKLSYWERHPKFDRAAAAKIIDRVSSEWGLPKIPVGGMSGVNLPPKPALGRVSPTMKAAPGAAGAEKVSSPRFGVGTVVRDLGDGKVQVVFDNDKTRVAKTLHRDFLSPV